MELQKKTILSCEGLFEPLSVDAEGNLLGGFGVIDISSYNKQNSTCSNLDNKSCANDFCKDCKDNVCYNVTCVKSDNGNKFQIGTGDLTNPPT